ncbi:MAG: long-chain-fatty-acid--CoA ligase [Actinomycetota bacterium]
MNDGNLAPFGRELSIVAEKYPNHPAVIYGDEQLTFTDFERACEQLASSLVAAGLNEGDVVALLCTNRPEWLITYQAALRAGLVFVPINWHLEADDIDYVINDCKARAVLFEDQFARLLPAKRNDRLFIAIGDSVQGSLHWNEALQQGRQAGESPIRNRGTQMIYTSGTTGRPKGVKPAQTSSETTSAVGAAMVGMFGMDPARGDKILCPAPLYHSGPSRICCEWPLGAGVGVVLMPKFDAEQALQLIERYEISHAFFVPTMFQRMLKVEQREKYDVSSLRFVLHGAGPCTVAAKQQMFAWFGPIIHEMYAASEGPGTWITPEEWLAHPGSVGKIDPSRIEIRDDNRTALGPDEEGVVWFRSVSGFEYHDDPEKTAATYDETKEWYTVGDRGRIDSEGYLFLTGRTSECIVSGGVNLYPARVDEALALCPDIVDGAAFGIADEDLGEILVAAVIAKNHADQATAERITDFCRTNVGSQLTPRKIFFVDELPRSDAGKLYRKRLSQQFSVIG